MRIASLSMDADTDLSRKFSGTPLFTVIAPFMLDIPSNSSSVEGVFDMKCSDKDPSVGIVRTKVTIIIKDLIKCKFHQTLFVTNTL